MKYSDIANLLSSAGTFLLGLASLIKSTAYTIATLTKRKEPKPNHRPRRFK